MIKIKSLWVTGVVLLLVININSQATESYFQKSKSKRYLMAALGDSITAGFLAKFPWGPHFEFTSEENDGELTEDSENDDYSRGRISSNLPFDSKRTWSWASGRSLESHYLRLRQHLRELSESNRLDVLNIARSGGRYRDIKQQTDSILELIKKKDYEALLYATLFIGNNDACHQFQTGESNDSDAEAAVSYFFQSMAALPQTEPVHILVVGFPRIPELGQPDIKKSWVIPGLTCHNIRDQFLKFCPALLNWKSDIEFQTRMNFVERKKETLEKLVQRYAALYPNLKVHFSNEIWKASIDKTLLTSDCFHPSRKGHRVLAETLWNDLPWFHK